MKSNLTFEEILEAKRQRRRDLARLPLDQKVEIIEKLHDMGRTLLAARASLPDVGAGQFSGDEDH
jgi:hypothetical protein